MKLEGGTVSKATEKNGAKGEVIASLDLGTHSAKCVIGHCGDDGQLDIIGTGSTPVRGLRGGLVHNRAELIACIKRVKEEAEMMAGCELEEVVASVSGLPVESFNAWGVWRVRDREVSAADVTQVLDIAQAHLLPNDKEVLHCVPGLFQVDEQRHLVRAVGIRGVRLEVEAHLVVGAGPTFDDVRACAKEAGLTIRGFVHAGAAGAETIIRDGDKELGVAIVDLGGACTEISVYKHRALVHTAVLPVGGDHVTADLHECLQLPMVEAERLKQSAGCALAWMVGDHEQVELSGGGGRRARLVPRTQVAGVIEARYEEILNIVGANLEHAGWPAQMLASVVVTGGASNIAGLPELADRVLAGTTVRGEPHDVYGLVDVVKNPRYATATGLVLAALRGNDVSWVTPKAVPKRPSLLNRLIDWIR